MNKILETVAIAMWYFARFVVMPVEMLILNFKERFSMKKLLVVMLLVVTAFVSSCMINDADVARANLERSEQNFDVYRRVVFYNGITDNYILTIEGYIAIIVDTYGDIVVTVKTDDGRYLKHYLGLSDNVTYFSEQLIPEKVSVKNYKVIFKPSAIIPNVEVR